MGALYLFLSFLEDDRMKKAQIYDRLERSPVIAATDGGWRAAVVSDAEVLFHTGASLLTVEEELHLAKRANKAVFVHIDLAAGIGRDAAGLQWLAARGADGIISTRTQLIRTAHECGLLTVQRFFVLDSKGMHAIDDAIGTGCADLIEIMPGVIPKALAHVCAQPTPVIAGGLIETKNEIMAALAAGALAVSTGKSDLWSGI